MDRKSILWLIICILFVTSLPIAKAATIEGYAYKDGAQNHDGITIKLDTPPVIPTMGLSGILLLLMGFGLLLLRNRKRSKMIIVIVCLSAGVSLTAFAFAQYITTTIISGFYEFSDVLPGEYTLDASAPGYFPEHRDNIIIIDGANTIPDITLYPIETPTPADTAIPTSTSIPTQIPSSTPTSLPTSSPTDIPTPVPTSTSLPTETPTNIPTETPTNIPTETPTNVPSETPTNVPTETPTSTPTSFPSETPTAVPTETPTVVPTSSPSMTPTVTPTSFGAGSVYSIDNIVGIMRYIPGGDLVQGSPPTESCRGTNETQFSNSLTRDIAVMETEVTRQIWESLEFVQTALPSDPSDVFESPTLDCPAQNCTWFEVVLFSNLLSNENSLTPCYYTDLGHTIPIDETNYTTGPFFCDFDANGYRLPSESEWEFFCRAGTTTPFSCEETLYDSGNCGSCTQGTLPVLEQYCVYCANNPGLYAAAGSKQANPWNLKDVHGNVWEWCWDWYTLYPTGPEMDYTGPTTGAFRIYRGGSRTYGAQGCRSARRNLSTPGTRQIQIGFRLVRTVY